MLKFFKEKAWGENGTQFKEGRSAQQPPKYTY